jgi:hypothetical protein
MNHQQPFDGFDRLTASKLRAGPGKIDEGAPSNPKGKIHI